jgi:hypothetical protein
VRSSARLRVRPSSSAARARLFWSDGLRAAECAGARGERCCRKISTGFAGEEGAGRPPPLCFPPRLSSSSENQKPEGQDQGEQTHRKPL